jgi:type I restriction enzyme M protein
MLDSVTKKRIDDLRNILVGKIPSPQSQVEQITTGLIYKFMYDMDVEAVEMGGVPSFFVDEYEKYSWKHLFDPKLGGADKVQLYSDAIENMYTNPSAPQLFREIFKNSFLPFKDPSTLNMFLKEINEFHYSHSEKLGDAFEYLLSFMGSQGDAGQFRTPRHIIDFIVEIVNPQKNETILDPACGTAGFLISSYKHILSQNTDKKLGDRLNASDRKQVGDNLVGYDISPDMTRISLVNMYLHQFASPQIHEYDTLSSEDRWNEYYDVILANPPFFSPTGGIQPHTRFGVQSTRAEVLFVDYIMEHLKPTGRAGIVVPEGIIFQNGNAYKTLRKKLVEDCLIGVISLPAGVFQPYSGVKTSILVLDKELNQKSDNIFFAKIENDGFSLGAQRTPIEKNDLIEIKQFISEFVNGVDHTKSEKFETVTKYEIQQKDFSLSGNAYKSTFSFSSDYPKVLLTEVASLQRGTTITKKDITEGNIPVIAGGQKPAYFHNQSNRDPQTITISSSGAYAGFVSFHDYPIFASDCFTVVSKDSNLNQRFLFHLLKSKQQIIYQMQTGGGQPHVYARDFEDFEIPLPPIEVQQQIVDELEGYQKIIDGCRQVVENYKPTIDIDPSWEKVKLSTLGDTKSGGTPKRTESGYWNGDIPWYSSGELNGLYTVESLEKISQSGLENSNCKIFPEGSLLIGMYDTAAFKMSILSEDATFNQAIFAITTNEKIRVKFLYLYLAMNRENYLFDRVGVRQRNLSKGYIDEIEVSLPSIDEQDFIVQQFDIESEKIESVRGLIDIYTQKIQDRISKVWGK